MSLNDDSLIWQVYLVRSNKLSLRTDIEPTRNISKFSSIIFTKYQKDVQKFVWKVVGVINLYKKLNKNKVNDLDYSIKKIGIGVNLSHSSVFSMNKNK